MTVSRALREGAARLRLAGVDSSAHDARALLAHVLAREPLSLSLVDGPLSPGDEARYLALLARRAQREPLQYILGEAWFMGCRFGVGPGVLIPRCDTETVCMAALERLGPAARVLDLCTGSGALAVAIKKHRPLCAVCAGDISPLALSYARKNAWDNGAEITFYQGDFFAPAEGLFDLIVCNPPYIPSGDMPALQKEVTREPRLALDGGADGLAFYRRFLGEAPRHLVPRGVVVLELGDGQAQAVSALAAAAFDGIDIINDLAGLPRALRAALKENPL